MSLMGTEFQAALHACVESTLKILILVVIGIILTYSGRLGQKGVSDLGSMTYFVSLPALIFVNVASTFNPNELRTVALIPCTSVVYIVIGYMVATFLCNFLRVPSNERNAVTCTVMFGNTGALAIALMTSLARTGSPHRFETYISIGVSYIALFIIGQNLIMFSWGEYLLSSEPNDDIDNCEVASTNPFDDDDSASESSLRIKTGSLDYGTVPLVSPRTRSTLKKIRSRSAGIPTSRLRRNLVVTPGLIERAASQLPLDSTAFVHVPDEPRSPDLYGLETEEEENPGICRGIAFVLQKYFMSPPLLAAILGLIVASVPSLKLLFIGNEAPLSSFTSALESVARMQVPASMLMLSGAGTLQILKKLQANALDTGRTEGQVQQEDFTLQAKFIIWFARNVTTGLVGFTWYKICVYFQLVAERGFLPFILFLEAVVPSAQNVVMLLLVHGSPVQAANVSILILQQYAFSAPFVTLYLAYAFVYLDPFDNVINHLNEKF